jgi:Bacterial Ig-like domain (group 1)
VSEFIRRLVCSVAPLLLAAASLEAQSYGTISTFAGTGIAGFSGDYGPATSAQLNTPRRVEVDPAGNIYIVDSGNNRIRRATPAGFITTVAGTGAAGSGGDNGPAVNAQINQPRAIIFDAAGNMYIADTGNNRVREVTTDGIITTVAGTGVAGDAGDGGPAANAQLNNPFGLAIDQGGNLYIADAYNFKIRRVDGSGNISTYAGTGTAGAAGDGGQATAATFTQPYALAVDSIGNLYVSDAAGQKIRKIDRTTGIITTFAGAGAASFSGDGGPATNAQLNGPTGMAFDSAGVLYFTDLNNHRVRRIDTSGIISTVAGDGSATYTNDGDLSLNAGIGYPIDVAFDRDGLMYVAQRDFNVVRVIVPATFGSQIIAVSGAGQSAPLSTTFPQPLVVKVIDKYSHPVNNVPVTFNAPAFGASARLSPMTANTNRDGLASATATANNIVGSYQITASVSGVSVPATFDLNNTAGSPSQIVFRTQPANTPAGSIINAVTVKVTDHFNNPVGAVTVTMNTPANPGALQGTKSITTGVDGQATFSDLHIDKTGSYRLNAAAGSKSQTSNSFDITPATSRVIAVLSGDGQSETVGTSYASPLTATVVDSFGNSVPGASVTFTAPSSGPSVNFSRPAVVTTDSNGVATSPPMTANSQSGAFQVTATTSGAASPIAFNLTNTPKQGSKLAFIQQPANAAAGQPIAPPVTVQLQDSSGNAVSTAGVPVTIQANPLTQRSSAISGTTTQNTNAAGLATFADLSLSHSGNYQLIATAPSIATAQSSQFTITAGSPASIATSGGTPQSANISTAFADPLAVVVHDATGNPVAGILVTFTAPASGASATLSAAQATTDATGRVSVTATANTFAGAYTVTATAPGIAGAAEFALTNVAAGASTLAFVQQPASTTAGATISAVSVKLTDSGNNPLNGVPVALNAQDGGGALEGTVTGTTDATGTATFNDLRITVTGTYRLNAVSGVLSALSNSFQITSAAAANITVFDGNGQMAAVGTAYAAPLRASVVDAFSNPIANAPVTFSAPVGGASVTFAGSTTVATDVFGIAASPVATANGITGTFQVTATTSGAPQPAAFNLTNVTGTANKLTFVQQPTGAVAGQVMTPAVTVQLQDSFGNPAATPGVAVALQARPAASNSRAAGTLTANTDATGLATFSSISINHAGAYTLTAEAAGAASVTSDSFNITAGPVSTIQATGGAGQTTAILTPFAAPLQVLTADALGNPVSGVAVMFTVPTSGASATLSAQQAITDATGHASVTAMANSIAGAYAVTAAAAGASGTAFGLTNLAAAAGGLAFVQQPSNTTAGATIGAVSVRLADSLNNPLSGAPVALNAQGGSGTLQGTLTGTTDATGTATFIDLRITVTGTYQLKAVSGALSAFSHSFQITPAAAANITVFDGDGQTAAVGTAYPAPLRVSVQDALGNASPNASVTFTAPASGASVTFAGATTATSNALGIAVSPTATANGTTGTFQVTAATSGAPQPATFNLTNVAGTANKLTFVQQPAGAVAGQVMIPAVTVQIRDSLGNPVATAGMTVALQVRPAVSSSRAAPGTLATTTDATGLATFSTIKINQAGAYTLTALAAGATSATSDSFNITAGPVSTFQAAGGTPQTTAVLTPFAEPLQVLASDTLGNPVGGVTVTFTTPTSGASATFSAQQATTDASGHAIVTATANGLAGSYVVAASAGSHLASFNLSNVAGGAGALTFVQQPVNTPAGSPFLVTAKVTDSNGNPVAAVSVTLAVAGGAAALIGVTTLTTTSNGIAAFSNLSIDATGTFQLQATAGALSMLSSSFQITAALSRTITPVAGAGQSAPVNTQYALPLTALVKDQLGNAVPGASVTFSSPASGAGVGFTASSSVLTDDQGIAISPALTANAQAGSFQAFATTVNAASPAAFDLTNLTGSANRLSFVQNPTTTTAGEIITPPVTVQIKDNAGNPVAQAGVPVTLASNSPATFRAQPPAAATDANGIATFSGITVEQAGVYTGVAISQGFSSARSDPFAVTPGIPSTILPTGGTPQSTLVSTAFPEALQATVTDSEGNPVSGATVIFLAPLAGAGGAFAGATTATVVTDQQGRAAVAITANTTAGTYTVTATTDLVTGTAQFVLTNLPASQPSLAFAQQPANAAAGQAISPPVVVRVVDSSGAPVPAPGIPILLSLSSGSGTLSGTTLETTDATGAATFRDLSIDLTGTKQLRAISQQNASAVSASFQITPGPGTGILAVSGTPQAIAPSQPFPSLLQARVTDGKGNPVSGVSVTFAAPLSGPSGIFAGNPVVATDANGLASAPSLTANNIPGNFSVTASAQGVAAPVAFLLTILPAASNTLTVAPSQIGFAGETAQPAPAPQTVQILNTDGRVESWTSSSSSPWLILSPTAGSTPATVNIAVNPTGLDPGSYSATVTFTTPTGQASLFVIYRITAKPALVASPSALSFLSLGQSSPTPQTVSVSSTGRTIGYRVTTSTTSPAGSDWLHVDKTQGQTPDTLQVTANTTGLGAGIYMGSVALTPTEAGLSGITIPVTLVFGAPVQSPVVVSVTNAASFHPGGAPGALMTIFGQALSDAVYQAPSLPLPQTLGPTSVTVNSVPAHLFYASPTQINFQMPSGQSVGAAQIVVNNSLLKTASQSFPVVLNAVDPGLFVTSDGRAAALNQDLSVHSAATPQPAGAIMVLYLTGQGPTTPAVLDGAGAPSSPLSLVNGQVTALIGGKPAEVVFAGLAPGFVGDTQVNLRIPQGVEPGDRSVIITINGVIDNAGVISVR